ncbi:D-inositol 3-phosphate glycosyltransferase [Stieleria maiorica]|uniref:D-inositol 3-phosphate glycosyltransferase n=1 Tax=Stieleria maiorica TaxID=2795974 RepID=A0A5B9MDY6_9BACT|nr:glycosyltransferase family 1 protein [Stieleria maiorica]QEF99472.1 D-inositol 3-phosphate glycosyltransferase [Stieleria maiorica]
MIRVALLDTTVPGEPGSMGRFREQLVAALKTSFPDDVDVSTEFLGCDRATLARAPKRLQMWRRHHHIWRSARQLDVSDYDVLHLLDGSFGYVADSLPTDRVVVTVHDVIPRLQMDGVFAGAPPVGRGAKWLINRALQGVGGARVVCADSQSTVDDLQHYGCSVDGGIQIVPLAVETELFDGPPSQFTEVGQTRPYLFHLGNNGFYKNRRGAIEILKRIRDDIAVGLVLAGPPPDQPLREFCRESGLSDRIAFVCDPDESTLANYYRAAAALVFPSLYEGFGWPPLEAMAAGCPVVSSSAGSLPEVVGQAGVLADSGDYDAMARGCERLLVDPVFRADLIHAGHQQVKRFSRQRLAERMISVYRDVVDRREGRTRVKDATTSQT